MPLAHIDSFMDIITGGLILLVIFMLTGIVHRFINAMISYYQDRRNKRKESV